MRGGVALTDEDRVPWIRSLCRAVREWTDHGRDVVLACSALHRWHRDALRDAVRDTASIRFVYLKGDYDEIDRRLRDRVGHFMPESLLKTQFATLEEPDAWEALAVPIDGPVFAIVDSILAGVKR